MEFVETAPAVDVQPEEYARLLGYPRAWTPEGRARELMEWARAWYRDHGRPWTYVRHAAALDVAADGVLIDGTRFRSPRLRNSLVRARAESAALVAVSAGPEAEREARRLWEAERPDEYFFLEIFASAVVEHLTTMAGARLCAWADDRQMAVLPHYSPGYPGWEIVEQEALLRLVRSHTADGLPGPLDVLSSGALNPKKSLLAVYGITKHTADVRRLTELIPCEHCSFQPCHYRRAPYRHATSGGVLRAEVFEGLPFSGREDCATAPPTYSVNLRALRRWAAERLSLDTMPDGGVEALFRYEGTTCTNMGRPLTFHYLVTLGPRDDGYPLRAQRCIPAPDDTGHVLMCAYLREGERLLRVIRDERPLAGLPLDAALSWTRARSSAGCYCDAESREHKWGLVLETIHYALSERNRA